MTGPLLTARELAELLGVSTGALLRWTRRGEVPAVKLPSGAVRYQPDAIAAWLDELQMGAAGEEVVDQPHDRTRSGAYVPLSSVGSTSRPHEAAANEEDHDGRT